jgi:hypothetical protein
MKREKKKDKNKINNNIKIRFSIRGIILITKLLRICLQYKF